jgi:hypothetical protein
MRWSLWRELGDFVAAMEYTGSDIPVAAQYHASSVVEDTASSVYCEPLPVLRQRLLLSALRVSQEPAGEAMRIISVATQMGGVVLRQNAAPQVQAWQLLISRYQISTSVGVADYHEYLFAMQRAWPTEVSEAAFQSFYSEVGAKAAGAGIYPQDDSAPSVGMRSLWWKVLSQPIGASQWVEVVRLALGEVQHRHSTVLELQEFYYAMLRNIGYQQCMATNQPRIGSIRFASGDTVEMTDSQERRMQQALECEEAPRRGDVAFGFAAQTAVQTRTPFPSDRPARPCQRCPLTASGLKVIHPRGSGPCKREAQCDVCNSTEHMEHSCFICHGLPEGIKLSPEFATEVSRLHVLCKAGTFDWRTTQTSLRWLIRAQQAHREQPAVAAYAGGVESSGDDTLAEIYAYEAEGLDTAAHAPAAVSGGGGFAASAYRCSEGASTYLDIHSEEGKPSHVFASRQVDSASYSSGGAFARPFSTEVRLADVAVGQADLEGL